jgi:4-aminobutyrate aminotransferase/(S)-3-amino-2-methylpropionate transaminase
MHSDLASTQLLKNPEFQRLKKELLQVIQSHTSRLNGIRGASSPEARKEFEANLSKMAKQKGRDPFFTYLSSGVGSGPFVELQDGSVKLDLITGIGINFFGHSHPALMEELIDGTPSDVMQGNLQPGFESALMIEKILSLVGTKSRLKHGWLLCSGTMANETALKIIRQKKFPATRIFAFEDCFAGRSTAMQEVTDNPGYRQGQPVYGEVTHLPFYNEKMGLGRSIDMTVKHLEWEVTRHPTKYAGLMIELIQGEGGIRFAPREYYVRVFEAAKKANLAVWADEIQTFGRTTELFAYNTFDLAEYFDVVTVGKMLHACMALYTEDMNPRAGLVAGTFTGSFAALKTGRRILEILSEGGYYGKGGKIEILSNYFVEGLNNIRNKLGAEKLGVVRAVGGMIGFQVHDGSMEKTKKFLMNLFDEGVVAFYAGHDPYVVRILPPFGVMTETQIDIALEKISSVLSQEIK